MSLFFWRTNKKHDEFAKSIANEFIEKFPNDEAHSIPNKKNKIKLNKLINSINMKAINYASSVKLGVYSKARIGNAFMWALKEEGYDEKFIDEMTKDLLATLSKNPSRNSKDK